jgi:hypothetical protein
MNTEVEGLPMFIESEDGINYMVEPFGATSAGISFLWENAGKHKFLFSDNYRGDFSLFVRYVLSQSVILMNVMNEDSDDPIGLLYADNLAPGVSARAHYIFWDHKQVGRHRILFIGAKWLMQEFGLYRISIEIPDLAYSALRRMQRMGVRIEGRRRGAFLFEGSHRDLFEFGILKEELTDEAIEKAKLYRTPAEDSWFTVLDVEPALNRAIMKKEH